MPKNVLSSQDVTNLLTTHSKCHGDLSLARAQALARSHMFDENPDVVRAVMNANTIPAELKRDAVLQIVISDFGRRILPLNVFCTKFQDIPLEGTNKVEVPFLDLDASASQSFVSGTGYVNVGNTVTAVREIEVGEGAAQGDRLFQSLGFTSQEIARQPFLKVVELARLKADKLASDIMADVLSLVTAANYGAPVKAEPDDTFDSNDVIDIKLACKLWPDEGRSLLLNSEYDAALLKDPSFKSAFAAASDRAIKEGKLFPRVMGFDYMENPTVPDNGEHLKGFAAHMSAALVAFAPVPPVEEVRNAGTTWKMFIDAKSGAVLEYRTFGNSVLDSATHIIESNYGYAKGNGNSLKRITDQ